MKKLPLLLVFLLLTNQFFLEAATQRKVDALIVLDMKKDIAAVSKHNGIFIKKLLQGVNETTKAKISLTTLQGNKATVEAIRSWFQRESLKKHDILFFYFSGHGMKNSTESPWPYFYLSRPNKLIDMTQVIELIESMPSRFSIILSDCCNSSSLPKAPVYTKNPPIDQKQVVKGMKTLFLKTKGHIRATAASPGQYGLGSEKGGLFTATFMLSLIDTCQTKKPTWKALFTKSSGLCKKLSTQGSSFLQVPYVSIEVRQ